MADQAGSAKAYAQMGREKGFEAMVPGSSQIVAISNSSTYTTLLNDHTTLARLFATQDCYLGFNGSSPTVSGSSGYFLPGGIIDFVGVGGKTKIAVLWSGVNGLLYVTEGQ